MCGENFAGNLKNFGGNKAINAKDEGLLIFRPFSLRETEKSA